MVPASPGPCASAPGTPALTQPANEFVADRPTSLSPDRAAWSGLVSRKWLSLLIALARKTGQLRCSCCHKRLIRRLCGSGSSRHHPFTVKRCCRGSQLVLPHRHSSGRGHLDFRARPGIYQLWQMRANYVQITAPITSRQTLFVRRDCLVALWAPPSL